MKISCSSSEIDETSTSAQQSKKWLLHSMPVHRYACKKRTDFLSPSNLGLLMVVSVRMKKPVLLYCLMELPLNQCLMQALLSYSLQKVFDIEPRCGLRLKIRAMLSGNPRRWNLSRSRSKRLVQKRADLNTILEEISTWERYHFKIPGACRIFSFIELEEDVHPVVNSVENSSSV